MEDNRDSYFVNALLMKKHLILVLLRRAYTMKFFFHNPEIFISKEMCRNILGSEMCVVKYYSVFSHNQVSFIRS